MNRFNLLALTTDHYRKKKYYRYMKFIPTNTV